MRKYCSNNIFYDTLNEQLLYWNCYVVLCLEACTYVCMFVCMEVIINVFDNSVAICSHNAVCNAANVTQQSK